MPNWTKKDQLKPGMTTQPLLWVNRWEDLTQAQLPAVTEADCQEIFGDTGTTRRLRTFGHEHGNPRNGRDPHFITIRNGYPMHWDPGFVRFTHHVVLLNQGYAVTGIAGIEAELMTSGAMYCIDSHSPHAVIRDPRLEDEGIYKLQAAVDADQPLDPLAVVQLLTPLLTSSPQPHLTVTR